MRQQLVAMRRLFDRLVTVVGLLVPREKTTQYVRRLRPFLLNGRRVRCVLPCLDPNKRLILLSPCLFGCERDSEPLQTALADGDVDALLCQHHLNYDQLTIEQVLRKLLPPKIAEIPTGFELVGHVVHLNLKPACLPYKHLIGQVVLDKVQGARCVINKAEPVQSAFRTFPIEVLAGQNDTNVQLVCSGCTFRFDYSKVYWNGRLASEHANVAELCSLTSPHNGAFPIVLDAFAGVGPFSILAAKKGCFVYANDLNPHSYKHLVENAKQNKTDHSVLSHNLDARTFIRHLVVDNQIRPDHVIMNLPERASEMLAVFRGLYPPEEHRLPFVHCYYFSSDTSDCINRALLAPVRLLELRSVKRVSPTKSLMRASFKLPDSIERSGSAAAFKTRSLETSLHKK